MTQWMVLKKKWRNIKQQKRTTEREERKKRAYWRISRTREKWNWIFSHITYVWLMILAELDSFLFQCYKCMLLFLLVSFFFSLLLLFIRSSLAAGKTHLLRKTKNNRFGWVHLWVTIKIQYFCVVRKRVSLAMLVDHLNM